MVAAFSGTEASAAPGTNDFRLPPKSCDSHCHVFGPASRFPYAAARFYTPPEAPKEVLAALHQRLGIDRAVIVQASAYGTDNAAMLDALRSRPQAYRGVAIIDDSFGERALESMHEAGVRGVRFNFIQALGGYPDMAMFDRAIAQIRPFGWHVVLHMKGADVEVLAERIERLPVPFVIDHMGRVEAAAGVGQAPFQRLLSLLQRDNAWVKVSGAERMAKAPFTAALPFARALVAARPERLLWGTDFPHPNLPEKVDDADSVRLIPSYIAEPGLVKTVLVDNPARLYGFAD